MSKKPLLLACFGGVTMLCGPVFAAQKIISGVPDYDQDVFPIDQAYASTERGDCTPVACTMLNGYYDAHGWPRLIPYGTNLVSQNAWGIDTVVRKYKDQLGYFSWWIFNGTIYLPIWDPIINGTQGNAIVNVINYFDPSATFTRQDDDFTDWARIQSYLNADHPCVLSMHPIPIIAPQQYKWEGTSTLNDLGGGHSVCVVGWSDESGRWAICNMGWGYALRAWFNYDNGADWYISQITPGGPSSGEDDDPYEDNDTLAAAKSISTGTISNLRCLDTLIVNNDHEASYGDWYKINVAAGQSLSVTISFTQANGDLDVRVYDPNQAFVASSEGTGNSENVTVASTIAGYYYIFVYGYNNAKNQNYSLTTSVVGAPSAINLTCSVSPSSGSPGFPFTASGSATYNNGGGPVLAGTVTITVGGQTYTAALSNGSYSRSSIYAPNSPGTYTVSVSAYDGAGRTGSTSSSVTVTSNGSTSNYTINGYLTCKSADNADPWMYHDAIDAFGSDDSRFYVWWEMTNITDAHTLYLRLYRPDGTLYGQSDTTTFGQNGWHYDWWRGWTYWQIAGYDISDIEGRWTVKLYVDGSYKRTVNFTLRYEFKEHRMCKDHQASSPNDPINPTSIFAQTDTKAETWCKLDKVSNALEMKWQWYEPNGSQYAVSTYNSTDPNSQGYDYWDWYKFWGNIGIQGNSAASKCGDWHVDVYIKDAFGNWDKEYTDYFRIVESPAQPPVCSVTPSPTNPVAGQTISLSVSATDNTYLKDVALHWKDGTDHTNPWSNILAGSLSQSLNVGPYADGQMVECWVVASDTSGNTTESSHKTVIFRADTVGDGIPNWWRQQYFGGDGTTTNTLSCSTCDADGDGMKNSQEYAAGTDPTNSGSAFRILSIVPVSNNVRVTWTTVGSKTNALQAASSVSGTYSNVSPNIVIPGSGESTTNFTDDGAATNAPSRFYRIRLVP